MNKVLLESLHTMAEASDSESAEEAVAESSGTHSMAEASNMKSGIEEAVAGPSEVQPTQAEPELSVVGTGLGPGAQATPEETTPRMETATPKLLPAPSSVLLQYLVVQSEGSPSAPTAHQLLHPQGQLNPRNNNCGAAVEPPTGAEEPKQDSNLRASKDKQGVLAGARLRECSWGRRAISGNSVYKAVGIRLQCGSNIAL
uniref:Uncharacterized protein n=1 Tax=Sphaerodactylus townsendi TaxID=933632 RepID=A0ACB8G9Q7_9SAUR